jgi:maltodextrin utilization protein YvdJ
LPESPYQKEFISTFDEFISHLKTVSWLMLAAILIGVFGFDCVIVFIFVLIISVLVASWSSSMVI